MTAGIGKRIKHCRLVRGLTKTELAQRAGTTRETISKLECGKLRVTCLLLDRIAAALRVDRVTLRGTVGDEGTRGGC